jgi:HEPN domain-containing protein
MPKPKDWVTFAEGDLVYAKLGLQDDRALAGIFYHCQQSAEKSLKAYLLFKKYPIKKTHDLDFLCKLCIQFDPEFKIISEDAEYLSPFSTKTRYPDDYYLIPSIDNARLCIGMAEKILNFVEIKLCEK